MDNLEKWAARAGIISAILAAITLAVDFVKPDVPIYVEHKDSFPYYTFFFFLFAVIAATYYLIDRLASKINQIHIGGDFISTNNIGDWVVNHAAGISTDQLEKILTAVSAPGIADRSIETLADLWRGERAKDLVTKLIEKNPDLLRDHISDLTSALKRKK